MFLRHKPYNLFLLSAVVLVLFSFSNFVTSFDIHLHDTYYVLPTKVVFWIAATIFVFLWLLYLVTQQFLYSKSWTWIHVISTILSMILLLIPETIAISGLVGMPRRYYDFESDKSFQLFKSLEEAIYVAFGLLILTQLIYLLNVGVGMYKKQSPDKQTPIV